MKVILSPQKVRSPVLVPCLKKVPTPEYWLTPYTKEQE